MAWTFQQSFEPEYRKGVELTPEMKQIMDADKQAFFVDVLKKRMNHPPGHAAGFKYPKPSTVYEFNCYYNADEFHNFMIGGAALMIPQRIIDIIEDIEPGAHQYFPVKLLLKSGEPEPEPYFILNVCTLIEALDREASNVGLQCLPEERHEARPWSKVAIAAGAAVNLKPPYDLIVSKDKIKGRAVWCEYGMRRLGSPFFSEEFVARVNAVGGMAAYEPHKRVGEI